jgi:hypothetical protein
MGVPGILTVVFGLLTFVAMPVAIGVSVGMKPATTEEAAKKQKVVTAFIVITVVSAILALLFGLIWKFNKPKYD